MKGVVVDTVYISSSPQSVGGGLLQSLAVHTVRVVCEKVVIQGLPMRYGTGRVVTLNPAQWCSSVQLWLPFCALLVSCQLMQ